MKRKPLLLGIISLLATATIHAQEFRLQPTPQNYTVQQDDSISIPRQYRLMAGNSLNNGTALPLLRSLMPEEAPDAAFRIYIGTKGDKVVSSYRKRIPQKSEGYFLKIEKTASSLPEPTNGELTTACRHLPNCLLWTNCPLPKWPTIPMCPTGVW